MSRAVPRLAAPALAALLGMLSLGAGGEETGEALTMEACFDCHGPLGVSSEADVPVIAGQPEFFFIDNFMAFKARERPCRETRYRAGNTDRPATSMCEIAAQFSDDEIQIMAGFFASQTFEGRPQRTNPALVEAGMKLHERHCERCHTGGGSRAEDDAGILAGQWMPYLRRALHDYREGSRIALEQKMQEKVDALSEEDVEALVHYYGSLGG